MQAIKDKISDMTSMRKAKSDAKAREKVGSSNQSESINVTETHDNRWRKKEKMLINFLVTSYARKLTILLFVYSS